LDIGMPELDGYEVARRLRGDGCRAVIVAVSGYAREEDRRRSSEAGFDHHMGKPIDCDQLLALLSGGEDVDSPVAASSETRTRLRFRGAGGSPGVIDSETAP
jgi:CheY-like chemotaxis protein